MYGPKGYVNKLLDQGLAEYVEMYDSKFGFFNNLPAEKLLELDIPADAMKVSASEYAPAVGDFVELAQEEKHKMWFHGIVVVGRPDERFVITGVTIELPEGDDRWEVITWGANWGDYFQTDGKVMKIEWEL